MTFVNPSSALSKTFNYLAVYSSFILRAFSFIILAPTLTKYLDTKSWGGFLAAQTLGIWIVVVFEFGFSLSFSRKITNALNDFAEINKLVGQVISGKLILMPVAALFAYFGSTARIFDGQRELAWLAFAWAIFQGFTPIWYFQARESLGKFSILDSFIRILYIVFVYYIVVIENTASVILFAMIISSIVVLLFSHSWMITEIGKIRLSFGGGIIAIKQGFRLALFTLVTSLYTNASLIILGFFVNPSALALYGNADRSVRAGLSLIGPVNQIFLPKSGKAYGESYESGRKFTKKMITLYFCVAIFMMCVGFIGGKQVITLLFSEKYIESVRYFYKLLLLIPLTAINTVIVYHFLVPNNKDTIVNKIYITVSILSIVMMVSLIPSMGLDGMLYAVLAPEFLAMIALIYIFFRESGK